MIHIRILLLVLVAVVELCWTCPCFNKPAKNCVWSSWSQWTQCVSGTQSRTRSKLVKEECGGSCHGSSHSTTTCTTNLPQTCGQRQVTSIVPAIAGGSDVRKPGIWPWMVSVQYGGHICGGVIIAKNWILTAAHCARGKSASGLLIRAGRHNLDVSESTQQIQYAAEVKFHPQYVQTRTPFALYNDVALIRLRANLQFNNRVQPVCLTTSLSGLDKCYSIGWGYTNNAADRRAGGVLQETPVKIASHSECTRRWSQYNWVSSGRVLCVDPDGFAKICRGDSGSPLICSVRGSSRYVAVGVASFSTKGCSGSSGFNSAYGDVTKTVNFIKTACQNCI